VNLPNNQLIASIHATLRNYRAHEKNGLLRISQAHIKYWVNQFDPGDRRAILIEMNSVFKKRYCSRKKAKDFLNARILELSEDFGYKNPKLFLKNCQFIDIQPSGRSQKIILGLLTEVLQSKFNMPFEDCGVKSRKYSIYVDDMLCTGTTLMRDLRKWSDQRFSKTKSNLKAVIDGSTELILCYFFLHRKNYHKKLKDIGYNISKQMPDKIRAYCGIEVNNENSIGSKLDLIFPIRSAKRIVQKYQTSVNEQVENYLDGKAYNKPLENFYRSQRWPAHEGFFTSPIRRNRVENAFLVKGIEILKKSNPQKENIRALGFALPSERNFGFGTLCFTWRNISNNTPLVFWYSASAFRPLFKKKDDYD